MTKTQLSNTFANMIVGVTNSSSLDQKEKDYIVEMLEDQLRCELTCLEFCEPIDPALWSSNA